MYQISNDEGKFSINSQGEITLVEELDREITAEYNLTITVTDRGQPPMGAATNIVVIVEDVNDEIPEFSQVHTLLV